MGKFKDKLSTATDEVSQVQPLYREELFRAVKNAETVEIEGKFATNGKLVANPVVRMAKVKDKETGLLRDAKVEDVIVKGTDGIFKMEYLKVAGTDSVYVGFLTLLECKLDQDLSDKAYRSTVILQVICYLKQLKDKGEVVPEVTLIGSKKNCFLLRSKVASKYIDRNIQGYTAASTAYLHNLELLTELSEDEELVASCFIYNIDEEFSMSSVVSDIYTYVSGNDTKRKLSDTDIAKAFDIFNMQVLTKADKISPREQVKYFLTILLNPDDVFINPKKPNKLVIGNEAVDINADNYKAFREQYGMEKTYTLEEQRKFTATADRLIEDADRRRKGDFYTPTVWVDEAHKLITKHLGKNWRNEYMVWDCAWGTGNLTRDYKFKELYCSTLMESDLTLGERYNPEAIKFQYDFLNDDVETFEKLAEIKEKQGYLTVADFMALSPKLYISAPNLIMGLLSGKKLLFLINPPYGTANTRKVIQDTGVSKNTMALTKVNMLMKQAKIGHCSQQLYAQFVYRIAQLKTLFEESVIDLVLYSKSSIQSSPSFAGLREYLKDKLNIVDSFYFCANEFANCTGDWGIYCSLWRDAGSYEKVEVTKVYTTSNGYVELIGTKRVYNLDEKELCSEWVKEKGLKVTKDCPQLSSPLIVKQCKDCRGTTTDGSLGYFVNIGNKVEDSATDVYILSQCASRCHGSHIVAANFLRVCVNFTARRLITGQYATWINGKDEYMIPNTTHSKWRQFVADSLIYCLFDNASYQSSLRNITYNGKQWNIKNEFFWLSRQQIRDLAQGITVPETINNDVEQDLLDFGEDERYMFKQLQVYNTDMSLEAQKVLNKATNLLIKSFKYRKAVAMVHPEYHLQTWDMGYYQMNKLIKEIPELQSEWKEFRQLFKELGDKMRPMVYELGFLYK